MENCFALVIFSVFIFGPQFYTIKSPPRNQNCCIFVYLLLGGWKNLTLKLQ